MNNNNYKKQLLTEIINKKPAKVFLSILIIFTKITLFSQVRAILLLLINYFLYFKLAGVCESENESVLFHNNKSGGMLKHFCC